jgi:hypothetical protein
MDTTRLQVSNNEQYTYNCWVQWNMENKTQSIPPLQSINPYFNQKEKTDQGKHGQRENYKNRRQPSQKIYSDILSTVRPMFEAAGMATMSSNRRGDQLVWSTITKKVRNKLNDQQPMTR